MKEKKLQKNIKIIAYLWNIWKHVFKFNCDYNCDISDDCSSLLYFLHFKNILEEIYNLFEIEHRKKIIFMF